MKIILSNEERHKGKRNIIYVPTPLLSSIIATLHQYNLLPKAPSLLTKRAADGATVRHVVNDAGLEYTEIDRTPRR